MSAHLEHRLLEGFRTLSPELQRVVLTFARYLATEPDPQAAAARIQRDAQPERITDPRDERFFSDVPIEDKLANLRHVSLEKYEALDLLLTSVLREEYRHIGREPRRTTTRI